MPINFYTAFFALSQEEARQFQILTAEDVEFEAAVAASAQYWITHLRPRYHNPLLIRQMFLAHSLVRTAKSAITHTFSRPVMLALTLALADKVEERVRKLDQEESNGRWD